MNPSLNELNESHFLIILMFALLITAILPPCSAASTEMQIPYSGSVMNRGFVITDGQFIAISVIGSAPPEIKVYTTDAKPYATVSLPGDTLKAMEMADGRLYYADAEGVFEYTIATGENRVIDSTMEPITAIVADRDHVVLRCGTDDRKLVLISLSKGTNKTLFTSHERIHGLAIDGDHIMWGCERADREPGREIHVYTISTGKDYIIPESKSIKTWGYGDISGDRVVWDLATNNPNTTAGYSDLINAGDTIQMTNLTTGKTISIESVGAPATPFISGDTIVYLKKPKQDYDNPENGIIRTYNIKTGSFNEFGSNIAYIQGVNGEIILWGRYKPMSFFVTSVTGTTPMAISSTPTQSVTYIPSTVPQNTSAPGSPIDPVAIVSALTVGIVGYPLLKKRE